MKYFIDSEFIEDGKTIDVLSLALVAENGREFYAEVGDAPFDKANEWVRANVIPQLWHKQEDKSSFNAWSRDGGVGGFFRREILGSEVLHFISACEGTPENPPEGWPNIEFWGYYADYDWVGFCQLFGLMIDLPKTFPMFCRDIKQLTNHMGNPELPKQASKEHHALMDARWNRDAYKWLTEVHIDAHAGELYHTYCRSVGGIGWNGDKLPSWSVFSNDPSSRKQARGWVDAALSGLNLSRLVVPAPAK